MNNINKLEAYELVGNRAAQLVKEPKIQAEMMWQLKQGKTIEQVELWVYMCAIGTLCGIGTKG